MLTDNQFDSSNRLTTSAYIMLDQIVQLMTKYPLIKLEVGVHTDNQGIPSSNLLLSQLRAQVVANYLITEVSAARGLQLTDMACQASSLKYLSNRPTIEQKD